MKKMISLFTAALMTVGMSVPALAADINVTVDNRPVAWTEAKPFIDENNRTLVPVHPFANAMGLTIDWNANSQIPRFSKGNQAIGFPIGYKCSLHYSNDYTIATTEIDTAAQVINGHSYAPAKYIAERFGYTVNWDNAEKCVTITTTKPCTTNSPIIITP